MNPNQRPGHEYHQAQLSKRIFRLLRALDWHRIIVKADPSEPFHLCSVDMSRNTEASKAGFSRLELVFTLAALLLLAVVALPVFANTRGRSEQVICLSNLRQLGHAVHLWATDHGDRTPWFTPVAEGGTRDTYGTGNLLRYNAWFQMGWMSNQLITPKILVCPSDVGVGSPRKMANNFSANSLEGGFWGVGYRSTSLSYLVGLHSFSSAPRSLLSGDRNISWDNRNTVCALGLGGVVYMSGYPLRQADSRWTNAIHGLTGNLLFTDGSAETFTVEGFQRVVSEANQGDGGDHHLLAPN